MLRPGHSAVCPRPASEHVAHAGNGAVGVAEVDAASRSGAPTVATVLCWMSPPTYTPTWRVRRWFARISAYAPGDECVAMKQPEAPA